MASMIELELPPPHLTTTPHSEPHPPSPNPPSLSSLLPASLRHIQIPPQRSPTPHPDSLTLQLQLAGGYCCILRVNLPSTSQYLRLQFNLVHMDKFLKINSIRNRQAFCKLSQRYNLQLSSESLSFTINMASGQIRLVHYRRLELTHPQLARELHRLLQLVALIANANMNHLLLYVNQKSDADLAKTDPRHEDHMQAEAIKIMEIRELIALSHLDLVDNLTPTRPQRQFKQHQLIAFLQNRENMNLPQLRRNYFLRNETDLFGLFLQKKYYQRAKLTLEALDASFTQRYENFFYKFTPKKLPNGENPFLYNTVLLRNETAISLQPLPHHSNHTTLCVADVEMAYTESENPVFDPPVRGKSQNRSSNPGGGGAKLIYLAKTIAVKMGSGSVLGRERVKHEKKIVQHLRTTCSPYFLKYYHSIQSRFEHRQQLLMDYAGGCPSLAEYAQLHSSSLFLSSQMHLFIHLASALRFLAQHNLTHLDLSTNNLLVAKDLLLKVIDFAEAYHPHDCDNNPNYSPGFTVPFCPPQVHQRPLRLAPTSDAFSFGIVLYRIIFGCHILTPTPSLTSSYSDGSYVSRIMQAGQGWADTGNAPIMHLLLQLVLRCLERDPWMRPIPYWSYVILNKIMQLFR